MAVRVPSVLAVEPTTACTVCRSPEATVTAITTSPAVPWPCAARYTTSASPPTNPQAKSAHPPSFQHAARTRAR
jgi:hypothetical protein